MASCCGTALVAAFCLLHFITAASLHSSGEGEGSCHPCVSAIYAAVTSHQEPCSQVSELTQCFEECSLSDAEEDDEFGVKRIQMVAMVYEIFNAFEAQNCPVTEDSATGCASNILDSLSEVVIPSSRNRAQFGRLDCGDEAYLDLLTQTTNQPDCVWRTHLDQMVSKARESLCSKTDRCLQDGSIYIVTDRCRKFYHVSAVDNRLNTRVPALPVAPGTAFNPRTCSLNHVWQFTCPI